MARARIHTVNMINPPKSRPAKIRPARLAPTPMHEMIYNTEAFTYHLLQWMAQVMVQMV